MLKLLLGQTYNHHNTLKFLIAVAPNSSITYISKAYTGRISDKDITLDTEYLDMLPPYTVLMCDKGFHIEQGAMQEALPLTYLLGREECPRWVVLKWKKQVALLNDAF